MYNIAICDDSPIINSMLQEMIEERKSAFPLKVSIDTFLSGKELYDELKSGARYDIVFLDICMPDMDGIELGHKIREELNNPMMYIVYISSDKDYALELFDVQPLGFLIKPLSGQKVEEIIMKALKNDKRDVKRFKFEFEGESHVIPTDSILYFEAKNKRIYVYLDDGACYDFRGAIKEISVRLEEFGFFRPHNAFLVNIEAVSKWGTDHIVMNNSDEIPIAQTRRADVKAIRLKYVNEKI